MSWNRILQNDSGPNELPRRRIDAMFAQQRDTWPALRDGEAALDHLQRKTLTLDDQAVIVQVNPARRRSTHATTDAQAIAARPCFLCPDNMPVEERGVAFEELVVLPNPYPILPLHCTIAHRDHRPQQLVGHVDTFLRLAAAIGPDMAALYNGPRCGASAPDHFHFQAARASDIPILSQLPPHAGKRTVFVHLSFGRNMLVFRSSVAEHVQTEIERTLKQLCRLDATDDEPMFNLLANYSADQYTAIFFPRAAHRPAQYFATGAEHLAISPAVLEMAGILVTTEPEHFARIDTSTARSIYEQVSIAPNRFRELVDLVG